MTLLWIIIHDFTGVTWGSVGRDWLLWSACWKRWNMIYSWFCFILLWCCIVGYLLIKCVLGCVWGYFLYMSTIALFQQMPVWGRLFFFLPYFQLMKANNQSKKAVYIMSCLPFNFHFRRYRSVAIAPHYHQCQGQNWVFSEETTSLTLMKLCPFHVHLCLYPCNFTISFSLSVQKCVFELWI